MSALLAQVLAGLAVGGIYALIALAIATIYRATGSINLAQGEMAMVSTFVAWQLMDWGLGYASAVVLAIGASFLVGAAIGWGFQGLLGNAPDLTRVTATIALFAIFNSLAGFIWGHTAKSFPAPFEGTLFGVVGVHTVTMIVGVGVLLAAVSIFFRFGRTGLAMRAAADNPSSAVLIGISPLRVVALGWGLAAAIGAVAGILVAPSLFLDPSMMSVTILYGLAAAVLGGLSSPAGVVIGGFSLGVVETLAAAYLPAVGRDFKLGFLIVLILAVLTLRPRGLIGLQSSARI